MPTPATPAQLQQARDEYDYLIPAVDGKGHSTQIAVRIPFELKRRLLDVVSHFRLRGDRPWTDLSHALRYYIVQGLERDEEAGLLPTEVRGYLTRLWAQSRLVYESDCRQETDAVLQRLGDEVAQLTQRGMPARAQQLVQDLYESMEPEDASDFWGHYLQDKIRQRWPEIADLK